MPTDVPTSFKQIARTLATSLEEDIKLHTSICSGIQLMIENIAFVADGHSGQSDAQVEVFLLLLNHHIYTNARTLKITY